ncbi:membrane dipeptidase [Kaistia soli DSM 19436]|uniref:Membrane dipeptidase n=1 Tax=Kaistia soli DSM 19436 TaxID=1122133 RepID=A0A1M4WYT6_9HYPH|nr:dipeptidase [Kaistia soli]SHE86365.1 membrane dipeptidase [Kaistia soli DSM 19436]
MTLLPIFDGHNDVLLRLVRREGAARAFLDGTEDGQLDLPRARAGGMVGGLFAVFSPPARGFAYADQMMGASYDVPLPGMLPMNEAREATLAMIALLLRIERESAGEVAICRDTSEIRAAIARGALATVLHIEGAEAIDPELEMLYVLHAAGLRSIGPVWSRPTVFGHGVPFRFPGSPDTGPGLTEAGERLVAACNALRILIDLSHLNEAGFWDVARLSKAPLVATHSNAHAITPSARNLTDRQLAAIRDSDGMVGLNFATCFLRPDGRMRTDTGLDTMLRHLDYLIERVGEDRVGFGSDFDGALIPAEIGTAAGLPSLVGAMRAHGYDEALLAKLGSENWLSLLERTIG